MSIENFVEYKEEIMRACTKMNRIDPEWRWECMIVGTKMLHIRWEYLASVKQGNIVFKITIKEDGFRFLDEKEQDVSKKIMKETNVKLNFCDIEKAMFALQNWARNTYL